ncbi:uncharacterized protein B0H64DRAFT_447310 [Chaetomium fimeti]|uniref:Uncharacterized protein n=1 Tax=Chaetomium fimeti TaxID=1854472 RepID=A0AAE0H5E0_9PEZI|nr:hypothetical protein B0H64DRAFT_447310 [Chaetomium fimeti]
MKFQLITAAAAIFAATAAALPVAETDSHGLEIDTDDWVDDGSLDAIEARDVETVEVRDVPTLEARVAPINDIVDNFNFTVDFDFALDRLLAEIDEIPDEILEKGDEVLHQWLVEHGFRIDNEKLKRDADASAFDAEEAENLSLLERGELIARASAWKIAKCVASIVQLLATTAVPAAKLLRIKKYIKALGGAKESVKLLLGATTRAEKLKVGGEILVNLSAELLGISTVKKNCF